MELVYIDDWGEMRNITSRNWNSIQPQGKWTRTGHIKQIELMSPSTGLLYMKEATGWGIFTYKMTVRSTRCDTIYRKQEQLEHQP